jgi:Flp pilus assembly protein TadD
MTTALTDDTRALTLCAEGAALFDAGDVRGAVARYRQATELMPANLALHLILANAQRLTGDTLGARMSLRTARAIASRPTVADEFELGRALVDAGAATDAVPCLQRVRHALPHDATAAASLAAALREAGQPENAWTEISRALSLAPNDPVSLHTAAQIRHDLGDFDEALTLCERSLRMRPHSPATQMTRGYLRHLLGDARGGWSDFEARPLPHPSTGARPWHGESLRGRSILLLGEQGVGDQFQCLRFAHHPSIRAADRVAIGCQPEAIGLLRAAGYDAISRYDPVKTDYVVPMLSVPHRLDLGSRCESEVSPYLVVAEHTPRTSAPTVTRAGVVWSGNPEHRNDAARSIPGSLLASLPGAHPHVSFVCMQHGVIPDDAKSDRWEYPAAGDWLDTARQLCTLDVLITVDTGIAHLAGAMGIPAWIMLPRVPDWRWGTQSSHSAWYPSARLFRQPTRGDWRDVLQQVSAAISHAARA